MATIGIKTNYNVKETEKNFKIQKYYPDNNVFGFTSEGVVFEPTRFVTPPEPFFPSAAANIALFCYVLKRNIIEMTEDEIPLDYLHLSRRMLASMGYPYEEIQALMTLVEESNKLTAPFKIEDKDVIMRFAFCFLSVVVVRNDLPSDSGLMVVITYILKVLMAIHKEGYFKDFGEKRSRYETIPIKIQ